MMLIMMQNRCHILWQGFKANQNILRLLRFKSSQQSFDSVSTVGDTPLPAPLIG